MPSITNYFIGHCLYLLFTSLHKDNNAISHFPGISCSATAFFPGLIPKLDPCKLAHSPLEAEVAAPIPLVPVFLMARPISASQMKHGGNNPIK